MSTEKVGGLRVKNLQLFNRALLTKWIWRFLTQEESLWSRIIKIRHGDIDSTRTGQTISRGGGCKTGWWSKVLAAAGREEDSWFWGKLTQKLGKDNSINFWNGYWTGDKALKDLFPCIFQYSAKRDGKVREMGSWIEDTWTWKVEWRRELMEREQEGVEEFLKLIQNLPVKEGSVDEWSGRGAALQVVFFR